MMTFKQYYTEVNMDFKVGQKVKLIMGQIGTYVNVNDLGGEDAGVIDSVGATTLDIRFSNGNVVKIKKDDIYSVGDVDTEAP